MTIVCRKQVKPCSSGLIHMVRCEQKHSSQEPKKKEDGVFRCTYPASFSSAIAALASCLDASLSEAFNRAEAFSLAPIASFRAANASRNS